jgi:hypothetical protein
VSLLEKVLRLKMDALAAARHASFWQKAITEHGEAKATEFYKHLGLNHLEKKSVEWEGLILSREPKPHEVIAIKGVSQAQESAKESINKILLSLRTDLIADGLKGIKKLKPATYHELTLQASKESRTELRDRLIKVHKQGRLLVDAELGKKQDSASDDEFDDLDTVTDTTLSRVVNETQTRIISSAAQRALLGLAGSLLISAIQADISTGSVSYIDQAAKGAANRTIGIGRQDEMRNRSDEIDHYLYSALLDDRVCENCAPLDGTEADNLEDLPEVPLADCLGGSLCRCFIIAIAV